MQLSKVRVTNFSRIITRVNYTYFIDRHPCRNTKGWTAEVSKKLSYLSIIFINVAINIQANILHLGNLPISTARVAYYNLLKINRFAVSMLVSVCFGIFVAH